MKIQLLAALTILTFSATTAQARGNGQAPSGGSVISNDSKNALAIGDASGSGHGINITESGGRAVAGSIYLTGAACNCDFESLTNVSRNAMAVGNATAGSIQISTSGM